MGIADDVVVIGGDSDSCGFSTSKRFDLSKDLVELLTVARGEMRYTVAFVFRPIERIAVVAVARIIGRVPGRVVVADGNHDDAGARNCVAKGVVGLDSTQQARTGQVVVGREVQSYAGLASGARDPFAEDRRERVTRAAIRLSVRYRVPDGD